MRRVIAALCALAAAASTRAASAQAQPSPDLPPMAPADGKPAEPAPVVVTRETTVMEHDVGAARSDELDHPVRAVNRALELQIGGGFTEGFGNVAERFPSVRDLSGPGGTVQATIGFRASPGFMIGLYGSAAQLTRGDTLARGTDVRSATAGIQADFHFRPSYALDPWVSVASGWRGMWTDPDVGKTTSFHGLEIARLQVGLDFRLTPGVAVAPVVGGDASMFLTADREGTDGFANIESPRVNVFLFGGLQARFDIGEAKGSTPYASAPSGAARF